jgi:hypothetical protein
MGMMVVNESDRTDYRGIGTRRTLGDQAIANQIAKRFGSVGIAQPRDGIIKAFEEVRIECNSDSGKDAHDHSIGRELTLPENWRIARLRNSWHDSSLLI